MYVSCSKEALASVGGRQALWATVPEIPGFPMALWFLNVDLGSEIEFELVS